MTDIQDSNKTLFEITSIFGIYLDMGQDSCVKSGATNRIMSSPSFIGNLECSKYDFNILRWALNII